MTYQNNEIMHLRQKLQEVQKEKYEIEMLNMQLKIKLDNAVRTTYINKRRWKIIEREERIEFDTDQMYLYD